MATSMTKTTANRFKNFIDCSSRKKRNVVCVPGSLSSDGSVVYISRLVKKAEAACTLSDTAALESIARELIPLKGEAEVIGLYYLAVVGRRKGNLELSREILESILPDLPQRFRAQALMSLARTYGDGLIREAEPLYVEALREAGGDLQVIAGASRILARGNLDRMVDLSPIAEAAGKARPDTLLDYWNELALELDAAGHTDQANQVISFVLRMPAALQKPHYADTALQVDRDATAQTHLKMNAKSSVATKPGRFVKCRGLSASLAFLNREAKILKRYNSWIRKNSIDRSRPEPAPSFARTPKAVPRSILRRVTARAPTRGPDCRRRYSRGGNQGSFNRLPTAGSDRTGSLSTDSLSGTHQGRARGPPHRRFYEYSIQIERRVP
jgi:hypothetical protein